MQPTPEELREEARRVRSVQFIVHFTSSVIMQGGVTRAEGEALVDAARARILDLFPGRDDTYELLYSRRFARLLDEYARPDPGDAADSPGSVVIPFRTRS
jgi:hypothetical protein